MNRRSFIKRSASLTAGSIAFPYVISSSAMGAESNISAANKITVGCIGLGWMGPANMNNLLAKPQAKVIAVCDIDSNHLENAKQTVNKRYGNKDCASYSDFREVLARKDIDAVCLSLPDHWHSIIAIEAAKAGKDIYGEKPFSHTLNEGRAMVNAVKKYGIVWQTGSWQRSQENFHRACELVRNGVIGKLKEVQVGLPSGFYSPKDETIKEPPKELDYNMWLGPAPYAPYCQARVHINWRWHLDYGGGQMMDWIGHHGDIAHWGLGFDNTGPVEINAKGQFPASGLWNAALKYYSKLKYADGTKMTISGGYPEIQGGTKWIGENGFIHVNRGMLKAEPDSLLKEKIGPNAIRLYKSTDHMQNFIDCIKSRQQTITPAETAHRSASLGHLSFISMRLGRKLKFNPETEKIIDDPQAERLLGKSMRSPWHLA